MRGRSSCGQKLHPPRQIRQSLLLGRVGGSVRYPHDLDERPTGVNESQNASTSLTAFLRPFGRNTDRRVTVDLDVFGLRLRVHKTLDEARRADGGKRLQILEIFFVRNPDNDNRAAVGRLDLNLRCRRLGLAPAIRYGDLDRTVVTFDGTVSAGGSGKRRKAGERHHNDTLSVHDLSLCVSEAPLEHDQVEIKVF